MNRDTRALVMMGVIGVIAGYLASVLVGGGGGLIGYLLKGVVGALVGGYVLNAVGINLGIRNAFASQVATATIGAIVVILVARIVA
jgi:uncharacterized membrane protein YeaQ/YmgE (transglycosylase-associated protein family)